MHNFYQLLRWGTLCCSFIFLFVFASIAQSKKYPEPESKKLWMIEYNEACYEVADSSQAEFYRLLKTKDGKFWGSVRDYYPNGQLRLEADSLVAMQPEKYEGQVIRYRPDGSKEQVQVFEKGKLKDETFYDTQGEPTRESWKQLFKQATVWYRRGDVAKTRAFFEQAKLKAEQVFGKDHRNYAASLNALATITSDETKDVDTVTSLFEEARAALRRSLGEAHPAYGGTLYNLAYFYDRQGLYPKAMPLYEQAASILEPVLGAGHPRVASILNNLAGLYTEAGRYEEAEPLYQRALEIKARTYGKKHESYANTVSSMAFLYAKRGDYKLAESFFQEALDIREAFYNKKHPRYLRSLNNLASFYRNQSKYAQAEPLYQEAIKALKVDPGENSIDYANALEDLGLLYYLMGKYSLAEPLFQQALGISQAKLGKDHIDYAATLSNLANLYHKQGLYAEAEPLYQRVLEITEANLGREHLIYSARLHDLANLHSDIYNFEESEALYQACLRIREQVLDKEHPEYAASLNDLANLYQKQEKYLKAEPLYQQVLAITQANFGKNHPRYANVLSNLAVLYQALGRYEEALSLQEEALRLKQTSLGENHPDYANSLSNLGVIYKYKNDYQTAASFFQQASSIYQATLGENHPEYLQALNNLASTRVLQGDYKTAQRWYSKSSEHLIEATRRNFAAFSEKEKKSFSEMLRVNLQVYYSYVLKAHQEIPDLKGWLYNLQLATKGLVLQAIQKMRRRILESKDSTLIQQFEQWQARREYLAKIYTLSEEEKKQQGIDQDQLEAEANQLEKEISLRSEFFAKARDTLHYTWRDIQKTLKPSEAAVEMIRVNYYDGKELSDSVLYLAVLIRADTQQEPELIILPHGNDLEEKFLSNYRNRTKSLLKDRYSYAQYWQPIVEKLEGIQKIYFSADGVYHYLNLNTLRNPETGKYLLESVDIHLLTSTQELVSVSSPKQGEKQALLLGRPLYDLSKDKHKDVSREYQGEQVPTRQAFLIGKKISSMQLADLPGTEAETRQVHQQLQEAGWQSTLYLQENALEEVVKNANQPEILHIATHGFFLNPLADATPSASLNPMLRSGIALSGISTYFQAENKYETEDGLLTAYEAANLDLDETQLVVLSACETGQGKVQGGEGVYGLQRGFQVAGAQNILMSLWAVSDEATQVLMSTFYQKWIGEKMSKRQAFRAAQLEVKEKYAEPYYWGAFVMVGE